MTLTKATTYHSDFNLKYEQELNAAPEYAPFHLIGAGTFAVLHPVVQDMQPEAARQKMTGHRVQTGISSPSYDFSAPLRVSAPQNARFQELQRVVTQEPALQQIESSIAQLLSVDATCRVPGSVLQSPLDGLQLRLESHTAPPGSGNWADWLRARLEYLPARWLKPLAPTPPVIAVKRAQISLSRSERATPKKGHPTTLP